MARQSRKKRARNVGSAGREDAKNRTMWYKVGWVALFLVLLSVAANLHVGGTHHPTPRTGLDLAGHVVPASRYQAYPRVAQTYEMVAAVPGIVDGIYCYCHCAEHSDHYSLLDCFASDHAARCDVCLSEATMVYRMSRDGHDLDAIRSAIDDRFRS